MRSPTAAIRDVGADATPEQIADTDVSAAAGPAARCRTNWQAILAFYQRQSKHDKAMVSGRAGPDEYR